MLAYQAQANDSMCNSLLPQAAEILIANNVDAGAIAIVGAEKVLCKKFIGRMPHNSNMVSGDTIFPIASLSKGFLGGLLAIMAEEKQFNWEQIASEQLKEFKLKNSSYSNMLSFHHIASMQSGLPEYAAREFIGNANNRSDIIASIAQVESIAAPGSGKFSYQYALLAVLEEIIKKRVGYEWDKLLQKKLLDPLKMINTGIDITSLRDHRNVVLTFDHEDNLLEYEHFKVPSAAAMYSSVNDLAKWVQLHLRDGEINGRQLISRSEISKMRNSYSAIEELEVNLANLNQVTNYAYGRFWRNYLYHTTRGANLKVIEHTGVSSGSSSIISFIPAKKIGIIVLTNKQNSTPLTIRTKFLQYVGEN